MIKYLLVIASVLCFTASAHASDTKTATVVVYDGDYIVLDVDRDRIRGKRALEGFSYCRNNTYRRGDRVTLVTRSKRQCGYRVSIVNTRNGKSCSFRCPRDW